MKYLKQWGLKRSGTNYARWMIEANVPGVRVLADVGGWKHAPPAAPTWDEADWYPEGRPGETPQVLEQLPQIKAAWESGGVGHLLCVRRPMAWIAGYHRYVGQRPTLSSIGEACSRWNLRARKFLNFRSQHPEAMIVLYERFVEDPQLVLAELCGLFGLETPESVTIPPRRLRNRGDYEYGDGMLPEHFRTPTGSTDLGRAMREIIHDTVDGDLLREVAG